MAFPKIANASELYFFKLLMMADTNIAFGEEFVVLDFRTTPKFSATLKAANAKTDTPASGGTNDATTTE